MKVTGLVQRFFCIDLQNGLELGILKAFLYTINIPILQLATF